MKKYIAGFVTCLILISALFISGVAEGFTVLVNPFPILFNGQPAEVEAYNINGRTFLALGDVAKYFNATATLNETTKQIEIVNNTITSKSLTISPSAPNLMVDESTGGIVDIETKEATSAEFIYLDKQLEEISKDKYVDYLHCKAVKYNGFVYILKKEVFSILGIQSKSMGYIEKNSIKFFKGNREVVFNTKDLNAYISLDGDEYFNLDIFKELIGE